MNQDSHASTEVVQALHSIADGKAIILGKVNMGNNNPFRNILHHQLALFILPSCLEIVHNKSDYDFSMYDKNLCVDVSLIASLIYFLTFPI